jgi:DNA ligase-1
MTDPSLLMSSVTIPTYPPLYISKESKTYQWTIQIQTSTTNADAYNIITTNGYVNGKQVVHTTEIKEGKVKRSVLEQAIQEANRKWKNKKEKELYNEEAGGGPTVENTTITVRPMLANKFVFPSSCSSSRGYKMKMPVYIQRKYDGIRCIVYKSPIDGNIRLESRKGTVFENFEWLKQHIQALDLPTGIYLDGELFHPEFDFETISGLVRLSAKKSTEKDRCAINQIRYYVYDMVNISQPHLPYVERMHCLRDSVFSNQTTLVAGQQGNLIYPVETIEITEWSQIKTWHDVFVEEGYEGIMIRDKDGPYEINKRSKYLQKYKEFMDEEFDIVGYHEGTGDESGTVIWDCVTPDGKKFAVRPRGTFESRKRLFETADQYIGKQLTVIFQEYSADGIPRFPTGKCVVGI